MSDENSEKEESAVLQLTAKADSSSGEEEPIDLWKSLGVLKVIKAENKKMLLYKEGLYDPGNSTICDEYSSMTDSAVFRHPYYNYPPILDPGIKDALLEPDPKVIYPDDGQQLYLDLCEEMDTCPVRLFHANLLNPIIDLCYYCVEPKGVNAMAKALEHNHFVKHLDLTDNFLNDDSCYHLGEMLGVNTTLEELILTGCRIGSSGLTQLGHNLRKNQTLTSLNLSRNKLGNEGGVEFGNLLMRQIHLKKVDLSKNDIGRDAAIAIIEGLGYRNQLTHLDLSWNNLTHLPSTVKLLNTISQLDLIEEVNLSFNSLEGEKVAVALYHLITNPNLKLLDLSFNLLQGDPLMLIVNGLPKAKKLDTFNLSNNPITADDACNILNLFLRPVVKVHNLLLECISVNREFISVLERVKKMKSRKNFKVVYGYVLHDWKAVGPDPRGVLLKRADFLGKSAKRNQFDIGLFFLKLCKENITMMPPDAMIDRMSLDNINLNGDLVRELSIAFAGTKGRNKSTNINVTAIGDYVRRLWPDRKLPPTPPPEPEEEPVQELPVEKTKKKGKK